jgi:DNA processing protein
MLVYQMAITFLPGIGDVTGRKLLSAVESPEALFKMGRKEFLKKKMFSEIVISKLLEGRKEALERAERELRFVKKFGIQTLFIGDKGYPYRLNNCNDAPLLLYYKGNAEVNVPRVVAVVGTRNATEYGRDLCMRLIEGLAKSGVMILSGLAFGIDSCAHKAALQHQIPTIGVLGHGLDRIYPRQNKQIAERMLKNGGLITDYPSETVPDRENFPRRNRIIAGMCDALIIVEAATSGGALITADIANSYNRDVFAVPGRITDEYSKGCNKYIRTNRAALVESAEDIRYLMGWDERLEPPATVQRELFTELSEEETVIVDILRQQRDAGIDVLVGDSGMKSSVVAKILLSLEFRGIIRSFPGKRYQLYV